MATKNTKGDKKPRVTYLGVKYVIVECEFCDAHAIGYACFKKGPFTNVLPYCPDHKKMASEKVREL